MCKAASAPILLYMFATWQLCKQTTTCAPVQQTREGCEFYIKDFPQLAGCKYSEARRRLPAAVLYG